MRLEDIAIREIIDSRGEPTIEVELKAAHRLFRGAVPAGKSRGSREAAVFSFQKAKRALEKGIRPKVLKKEFRHLAQFDAFLLALDGTTNKTKLGGNVMLGASIAATRALAAEKRVEPWQVLHAEFFRSEDTKKKPLIFSNLINGGAHAKTNLSIQEYMVVVRGGRSMVDTVHNLTALYQKLGEVLLRKSALEILPIGDEGGYALWFRNNKEPLTILEKLIKSDKRFKEYLLALDAAATNFYVKGGYQFDGKVINEEVLCKTYLGYAHTVKRLFSIDDPFREDDASHFGALHKALPQVWVVGDDLTVTNPVAIEEYARGGSINAVIIKPNQVGTVTESCEAINVARAHKVKTIISHRSGETEDPFIIHLAKASGADGVKIGAPVHERLVKYNELIRLYS